MHIKNFEAETMSQALLQVKREFGPDAVILSARSVQARFRKNRRVEVTAATDSPPAEIGNGRNFGAASKPGEQKSLEAPRPWQAARAYHLKPSSPSAFARRPRRSMGPAAARKAPGERPRGDSALRRHLRRQGIGRVLSAELAREIELFDLDASPQETRQALASVFGEMGLCCERIRIRQRAAAVAVMMGPPGVGKTTTVAKLAALARNRLGPDRVGIIAIDNTRLGAVEQLLNFSAVVGVDARVVRKPGEFSRALAHFRRTALVLVDTAGVNGGDRRQLLELNNFFQRGRPEMEVHLLLAASTKEEDMLKMAARFKALSFSRLLFTKVDESSTHGNLVNVIMRTQTPVSYLSQGQNIPEDLKIATLDKLADLVLGDEAFDEADQHESVGLKWMTA